ncbi:hypothetical protein CCACVL1_25165 [Corchorus capsularis]|uniref:Uncharacterized protein n=1 Tax=Corchorus capsularis TaxID=210143 RepID=A0A1R3GLP8_COCAP|nr:hypothetical protein CCACVL1_25165 [Corchorus capsularis]
MATTVFVFACNTRLHLCNHKESNTRHVVAMKLWLLHFISVGPKVVKFAYQPSGQPPSKKAEG